MNKNLIFCALAFDEHMKSGVNMSKANNKVELYLKNAFVALFSAKKNNPECEVALVTNLALNPLWENQFSKSDIKIYRKDFDCFRFGSDYTWGLAFYKLCAIKRMLELHYDNYLIVDTDVYFQSGLDDLWKDTQNYLMLYDINHRPSTGHSIIFDEEVRNFSGIDRSITNWGGEFIAANNANMTRFISNAEKIYDEMIRTNFVTTIGDEFITRLAADRMDNVKNAGGYIFRFWTNSFRLVSTCYKNNAVSVLHCPNEKRYGMLTLYRYISKKWTLPSNSYVHRCLHLKRPSVLTYIKMLVLFIKQKV